MTTAHDRAHPRSGVIVLGMHRSGTSAVTRAVNLLGVPLGREDDLYTAPDNPSGHWESRSLCVANDRVLNLYRRTSIGPPRLWPGWEFGPTAEAQVARLQAAFAAVYDAEPWLWKDPRLCLTLPLWRRILHGFCVVFVVRSADSVATSLARREGSRVTYGRAVWDEFNRSAVRNMAGLPVVVVHFDRLLAEPTGGVARLAEGLQRLGVAITGDVAEASASVRPDSARNTKMRGGDLLTRRLAAALDDLPEVSESFVPPRLPRQAPWIRPGFQAAQVKARLTADRTRGSDLAH